MICEECLYYKPVYGTFGWYEDGLKGYCYVEPKLVFVDAKRVKCRHFLPKKESEGEEDE